MYYLGVKNFEEISLSPADLAFPRWGTVRTGPTRWTLRVFWSAPGCLAITCLTLWWEPSTVSPARSHSPSARRHLTATSIAPKDWCLWTVLPEQNVTDRMKPCSGLWSPWMDLIRQSFGAFKSLLFCTFNLYPVCCVSDTYSSRVKWIFQTCVVYNSWQHSSFSVASIYQLCLCVRGTTGTASHWFTQSSFHSGKTTRASGIWEKKEVHFFFPLQNAYLSISSHFWIPVLSCVTCLQISGCTVPIYLGTLKMF